jgi:hypothetical protein
MNKIDLTEEQQGCLCLLCDVIGESRVAHLLDRDLGPLCHDCFSHALRATTELRWSCLTFSPSHE